MHGCKGRSCPLCGEIYPPCNGSLLPGVQQISTKEGTCSKLDARRQEITKLSRHVLPNHHHINMCVRAQKFLTTFLVTTIYTAHHLPPFYSVAEGSRMAPLGSTSVGVSKSHWALLISTLPPPGDPHDNGPTSAHS